MADTLNIQPIILAAGKGTRMNSALPKVLVGLVDRPLIQHLLDNLKSIQFSHPPVIVVGHKYELVQSYLGTNLNYAFQEGQLGTAHAAQAARSAAESVLPGGRLHDLRAGLFLKGAAASFGKNSD